MCIFPFVKQKGNKTLSRSSNLQNFANWRFSKLFPKTFPPCNPMDVLCRALCRRWSTAASPSCRVASVLGHTLPAHGHCLLVLLEPHCTGRDPGAALCHPPWGILLASEINQDHFPHLSFCCPQFGYFFCVPFVMSLLLNDKIRTPPFPLVFWIKFA